MTKGTIITTYHSYQENKAYLRMKQIVTSLNRVTKIFSDALKSDKNPLVAYYGAIAGLQVNH